MSIVGTDIQYKLSISSGTAGYQSPQPNPKESLGKYISTTTVPPGSLNNIFDNISGSENAASQQDYRCVFVYNAHPDLALLGAIAWFTAAVAEGAEEALGVDPAPASPIGQTTSQAAAVPNETTAPTGVTFAPATSKENGVQLGDIPAGHCRGLWIRRSATNTVAKNNDGFTIRVEGDSGE